MASIKENYDKDGNVVSYRFRCCVGRDEKGNQVFRSKTIPKPLGLTPKKTRKEAERLADEWERQQKEDYSKAPAKEDKSRTTLASFVRDVWIPDHVHDGDHTPGSIVFYEFLAGEIVQYFGDKVRLSQIDTRELKRFLKYLRTEATTKKGTPLKASTIQHIYGGLRNILNVAKRFGYIRENPCDYLTSREKPKREQREVDFLTKQDALRFLKALESEPLYWRVFASLLIFTGLRRGEAVGLQWRDVSKEKITVRRNVTQDTSSENKRHVGQTKTRETREVYITTGMYALLMQLKHEQEETFGPVVPTAYIFHGAEGPFVSVYPSAPTRWQNRFVKKHGLPDVSPHDLRHTAASLALEAGADLKQVQDLLGHHDVSTTLSFYTGLSEQRKKQTGEQIEQLLAETETEKK